VNNGKPRIGVFKYSCCAGCEFQLIFFQKHVLETLGKFDIVFCRMLQSGGVEEGPFDVALIEGAITEQWQVEQLRRIRSVSQFLIPIGSCAVCGGIPAIKNNEQEYSVQNRVYEDTSKITSIRAHPIDQYVPVDGYIKGCPMGERDLVECLTSLLLDKRPEFLRYPVCVECKHKYNICVLVAYHWPCMGPVTNAGCGALCPSHDRACYGCWGPMRDAHATALANQFAKMGLSEDDIFRLFTEFGEPTVEWKGGQTRRVALEVARTGR
jgi:coenzyme F420-reducing hydrogenase gamma subunit